MTKKELIEALAVFSNNTEIVMEDYLTHLDRVTKVAARKVLIISDPSTGEKHYVYPHLRNRNTIDDIHDGKDMVAVLSYHNQR